MNIGTQDDTFILSENVHSVARGQYNRVFADGKVWYISSAGWLYCASVSMCYIEYTYVFTEYTYVFTEYTYVFTEYTYVFTEYTTVPTKHYRFSKQIYFILLS